MGDPGYPAFSIFSFLSFIIVLIPLPWHLQAWNSGTCLFMIWVAVACLNMFINSIIWRDNAIDSAPLFCDISTRISVGVAVAIPAASLCINRRLYKIASCSYVSMTAADKKRAVIVDLAIGLGIPFIQMPLQFVVQGHRYDLFEGVGCFPTTVNTPMAYPLSFLWPNIISLISAFYCIMTLREFMKRRAQFSQFINSNASLSVNRYFRLMSLATAEIAFTIPISTYGLYLNITNRPIYPWQGWANLHYDWYIIDVFPAVLWRASRTNVITLELSRWSLVFSAVVFFAFFGFADEACKHYRLAYWAVAKRFGVTPPARSLAASKISPPSKGSEKIRPVISKPVLKSAPLDVTSSQGSAATPSDRTSFTKSDYSQTIYHTSHEVMDIKLDNLHTPTSATVTLHGDAEAPPYSKEELASPLPKDSSPV